MNNTERKNALVKMLGRHLYRDYEISAYVLVDHRVHEPFKQPLLDEWVCESFIVPVQTTSCSKEQLPRLIRLNPKAPELLDESVSLMLSEQGDPQAEALRGFAIGGWLFTRATGEALARHLARCMGRTVYETDKWKFFCWQDRRVMEWMWPSLTSVQQQALMGPITEWWTLDRRSELTLYQSACLDDTSDKQASRFVLDTKQIVHAKRCQLIQTVIRGWRMFSAELPADYLRTVDRIVNTAIEQGAKNSQDITLLAAYALQLHPDLLLHPTIRTMIHQATRQSVSLTTLLGTIKSPHEWAVIQHELKSCNFDRDKTIGEARA